MTRNQISYLELLEKQRSNKANERETHRSNTRKESETERSNRANESVNLINSQLRAGELAETIRSNQARETELNRSNLANEQLKADSNAETRRSNLAREAETFRSNQASEQYRLLSLEEEKRANRARESVNWYSALEQRRSNVARETETHRSNLANETETNRANIARETETRRSNLANEAINQDRNDLTREHYERSDYETERANRAREALTAEQNAIARDQVQLGYDSLDWKYYDTDQRYKGTVYASNASSSAARYAADTNAAVGWGNIAEANRHNQQAEWNQQLATAADYRVRSQQADNQRQSVENQAEANANQMTRWYGESDLRESQTNFNNERAKTESDLRNARRHNLYSDTVNNYTRSFSNVWSTLTGGKTNGKKK